MQTYILLSKTACAPPNPREVCKVTDILSI